MENAAEIQYEIDANDLTTFYVYNLRNNPKFKWFRTLMSWSWIGIGIIFLILAIVADPLLKTGIFIAIIAGLLGLYCLFWGIFFFKISNKFLLTKIYARMYAKPNRIAGHHRVSINSDGITDINDVGQNITHWNGIQWFANTDKYLFLASHDNSIINVVPMRAFTDENSFNQFVETASYYYENTKAKR